MDLSGLLLAIIVGILQGIFEWLPISSEGNITIVLTALGETPGRAVRYSLFLHLGTAIAATSYYRTELLDLLEELSTADLPSPQTSDLPFLAIATLVSGAVGFGLYKLLLSTVTALEGSLLIIAIGVLLVLTGVFQRQSVSTVSARESRSVLVDSLLVGVGQGAAILPGISRSGTTVGVLLLRGYDGSDAFRLSFILSIPAAIGAALLVVGEVGGLPSGIPTTAAVGAIGTSAIVGYLTIEALMRFARRVSFWRVCIVLGMLAVLGGLLTSLL